MTAAYIGQLVG